MSEGLPARIPTRVVPSSYGGLVASAENVHLIGNCERIELYRDDTIRCLSNGDWTTFLRTTESTDQAPVWLFYDRDGNAGTTLLIDDPRPRIRAASRARSGR